MNSTYYIISERRISAVTMIDDLGIYFNKYLSFEKHINVNINKANSLAGMIQRSFVYLNEETF